MERRADQAVWKALAEPTRRKILDLLREGPRTTGDLCSAFRRSRFAVMKHLGVLERAKLVLVRPRGRERWNYLNVAPIHAIYDRWVRPYESIWASGFSNLKRLAEKED